MEAWVIHNIMPPGAGAASADFSPVYAGKGPKYFRWVGKHNHPTQLKASYGLVPPIMHHA